MLIMAFQCDIALTYVFPQVEFVRSLVRGILSHEAQFLYTAHDSVVLRRYKVSHRNLIGV
jgi:hypothetical protein